MADLDGTLCTGNKNLLKLLTDAEQNHCIQDARPKKKLDSPKEKQPKSKTRTRPKVRPEAASRPEPEPDDGEKLDENDVDNRVMAFLDLKVDKQGNPTSEPKRTKNNLYIILKRDRRLRGRIWLNTFTNVLKLDKRDYKDTDDTRIVLLISRAYDIQFAEATISMMTRLIGEENGRNPLTDSLDKLEWDGEDRIENWIVKATGCDDIKINKQMGEKWLIQAIARAYQPGCKADCILILTGRQGAGKSTMFRALATEDYFADTPLDIGSANSYTQIARAWIYEVAELDSVRRSQNSATKAFFSAQEDNYRPAYGRNAVTVKRHVVFAGTTNDKQFINDDTGSRRYWPVNVEDIDLDWVKESRDQLWAEAIVKYRSGVKWYLDNEMEDSRQEESKVYRQDDPWVDPIAIWLRVNPPEVTTHMVMEDCLKIDRGKLTRRDEMRVATVLTKLGLSKVRRSEGGKRRYVWVKPEVLSMKHKKEA